jgi:acyl-coenzyme A synthetase/AMP-(fatty) acid ligase
MKAGQEGKLTSDDVKAFMTEKVAKFKVAKKVYFTDIMPKTATGKVQRRQVAAAMLAKEGKAKL